MPAHATTGCCPARRLMLLERSANQELLCCVSVPACCCLHLRRGTNYAMWVPFIPADATMAFRFHLEAEQLHDRPA
jgi:hypothetical protein